MLRKQRKEHTHTLTYTPTYQHTYIILQTLHSPTDGPNIHNPTNPTFSYRQTYKQMPANPTTIFCPPLTSTNLQPLHTNLQPLHAYHYYLP